MTTKRSIVPRSFYLRPAVEVARDLIGTLLVRNDGRVARIVETEAYTQTDEASHTYRGKTARNQAMFEEGGHMYVYFTYGCHFCANVVTGMKGDGSAVLLRAGEPLEGVALMARARGMSHIHQLCSGPGKLAQAFGIDKSVYGIDLTTSPILGIMQDGWRGNIDTSTHIGISKAQHQPWRFGMTGSAFLSKKM